MMNLLCYNIYKEQNSFYFNNIELKEFFEMFSGNQKIVIASLFAHGAAKEYDEHDFLKSIEVSYLSIFKEANSSVLIDKISFFIDSVEVSIADEYEYTVMSIEPHFSSFINKLYKLLRIDSIIWNVVKESLGRYVLVENSKIICTFSSFDEYLESGYSRVM